MKTPRTVHGWAHWGVNGLIAALLLMMAGGIVSGYATATQGQPQPGPTTLPELRQTLATEAAFLLPERPYRGITVVLRGPALDARRQLVAGSHPAPAGAPVASPRAEADLRQTAQAQTGAGALPGADAAAEWGIGLIAGLGGPWVVVAALLAWGWRHRRVARELVLDALDSDTPNSTIKERLYKRARTAALKALAKGEKQRAAG